ncbi:hypothetical protein, partial [Natronobacterium gregoryi]
VTQLLLLGIWAVYTVRSSPVFDVLRDATRGQPTASETLDTMVVSEPIVFLGYSVPGVAGVSPMQTLFAAGIVMMFGGLALAFRAATGSAAPVAGY